MGRVLTRFFVLALLLGCTLPDALLAQVIEGVTLDVETGKPVDDVLITNVHLDKRVLSGKDGRFSIEAASGQLIEFKKEGYKVYRLRLPQSKSFPYFKMSMQQYDPAIPQFDNMAAPDYKTDSLKYALLYKNELNKPRMSTVEAIQHPFSAMSKKNRQVWAFQVEYARFQEQKFIDYTFSDNLIASLTGLTGDSLRVYRQMFRPTYTQLRAMNEYAFLNYVKRTVAAYRKYGNRARKPQINVSH
ncbi:MAG TPA: hypothetical protein VK167_12080 [Flavipsychrobacter sp.]|nr:hypothetical protein [Chitinophagales bacterium]HLO71605.1 hypothetical protein [Flavipsychrobacter sp.]